MMLPILLVQSFLLVSSSHSENVAYFRGRGKSPGLHQFGRRLPLPDETVPPVSDTLNEVRTDDSTTFNGALPQTRNVSECQQTICEEVDELECGACHSIYMRECIIKMEPRYHPIQVKECIASRSDCSQEGFRRTCATKYRSECSTRMEYRTMEEDYPVCKVEKVEVCKENTCNNLDKVDICKEKTCKNVPVMKCSIQKKSVRKMKPRTSCERRPYRYCRKEKCKKEKCFNRVSMHKEMEPKEECSYREGRF